MYRAMHYFSQKVYSTLWNGEKKSVIVKDCDPDIVFDFFQQSCFGPDWLLVKCQCSAELG